MKRRAAKPKRAAPRKSAAPKVGTSAWYAHHIRATETMLASASPTAYAALIRKIEQLAKAHDEKLREEQAESGAHLTAEQRMERWQQQLARLPDAWLEVAVREWADRRRLDLHALIRGQLAIVRASG